jgi:hypothetical protein
MNDIKRKRIMDIAKWWPPAETGGAYSPYDTYDLDIYAAVIESATLEENSIMLKVKEKNRSWPMSIELKDGKRNAAIERMLPKAKGMKVPEFGTLEVDE